MWIYKSTLSPDDFLSSGESFNRKYLKQVRGGLLKHKDMAMPYADETKFSEYEGNGKRIPYESVYFKRRTMLRDFAINAWLGDDDAVFLYEKTALSVCEEISWSLPAHVGKEDRYAVIDLFAAETAHTLIETASLLRERISEKTLKIVIAEVRKRVVEPFINRKKKYNWETMENNWCAVCGGAVGMTLIYLTENTDELKNQTACLKEVFESYMESFTDDGACLEGLYYWGYGMMYLTAFLELYRKRTGDKFPVNETKLSLMADFAHKCCISDGITVSFSDGNENDRIYSGLLSRLTEMYGAKAVSREYMAYYDGDECGRWCKAARDIAWTRKSIASDNSGYSVLPKAQWAVVRGKHISFAIKGGNNNEPHNHNDIGSIIVVKDGKAALCDLGAGEYTREYFSQERYNILCNRSMGHSVPIVDGQEQKNGEEYAAHGFILEQNKAEMDISGAYGAEKLRACMRSIELTGGKIVLTDTFCTDADMYVTERFITRYDAVYTKNGANIISGNKCILSIINKDNTDVKISHLVHREHNGDETKITAIDFKLRVDGEKIFRIELQ